MGAVIRCDVAHAERYSEGRPAAFDLGRHMRVVGIPGSVRYLCADCARGRISPKFQERFRMGIPPETVA